MKQAMLKLRLAIAFSLLIITGCGSDASSNGDVPNQAGSRDTPQLEPDAGIEAGACAHSPIVVKTLCIGMPLSEAVTSIERQLGEKLTLMDGTPAEGANLNADFVSIVSTDPDVGVDGFGDELRGRAGSLTSFDFKTRTIGSLFKSADMSPEEFAQAFVVAYGIGEMPGTVEQVRFRRQVITVKKWTYRYDEAGVSVEIMAIDELPSKSISVSGVTKASERSSTDSALRAAA